METKICNKCHQELPLTEFGNVPSMASGKDNTCKNCRREMKGSLRTPDTLHCPVCNQDLPYYMFDIARKSKTGRTWCCHTCLENKPDISANNFRKMYDNDFKNLIYKQKKESRQRNFEHNMWKAAKKRALQNGLDFNIEESDIIIPEKCPILEHPLEFGTKDSYDWSPSLDRIDNSKGYTKGNIWVISKKANTMKSSATWDEITKFCTNILRYSPNCIEYENAELEDKEPLG